MRAKQSILLVEDEELPRRALAEDLREAFPDLDVIAIESAHRFFQLSAENMELVAAVLDIKTGGSRSGLDVAKALAESHPGLPVVIWSCNLSNDEYAEAIHPLTKGGQLRVLCVEKAGADGEVVQLIGKFLREADSERSGIVLQDRRLREAYAIIPAIGEDPTGAVLVLGPSGSGKEEFVRRLHKAEGRTRPCEAVNGAAIDPHFAISELFGHLRGSYTGADRHHAGRMLRAGGVVPPEERNDKISYLKWLCQGAGLAYLRRAWGDDACEGPRVTIMGRSYEVGGLSTPQEKDFRQISRWCVSQKWAQRHSEYILPLPEQVAWDAPADNIVPSSPVGTLFIDEVGDLPVEAQVALLRALNGDGFYPLGYGGVPFLAHVRVVAATNRIGGLGDLERCSMRADLFWRLAGWIITLPGVAEMDRGAREARFRFLVRSRGMDADSGAVKLIGDHLDWPGNWRQVEQVSTRAIAAAASAGSRRVLATHVEWAFNLPLFDFESRHQESSGVESEEGRGPMDQTRERAPWSLPRLFEVCAPDDRSRKRILLVRLYESRGQRLRYEDLADLFPGPNGVRNLRSFFSRWRRDWPEPSVCGWILLGGVGGYAILEFEADV